MHGTAVGLVSCDDVRALQKRINSYRSALGTSIDLLKSPGVWNAATKKWESRELGGVGPRSTPAWTALGERCSQYEEESCTLGLFAGSQFDRGRALVTELDGWRDFLASVSAPSLPDPVPTPASDVSLAGGIGWGLAAIVAVLVLREIR